MTSEELEQEILELVEENKKLIRENDELRDENDSLWMMLDEIHKSDVEEHTHLLKELEKKMALNSLMYTKKKGYA
tara:strand:- start:6502 stop:6726 length:225 start_codon:yes stop_codon:yes gene_type:complete